MALDLIIDDAVAGRLAAAEAAEVEAVVARMVDAATLSEGSSEPLEVCLRLTDDDAIAALNRDFRDKDRPTDVLAFAQREGALGDLVGHVLGDVVISVDTAARQGQRGLMEEILFLAAHGLCHLLGYDHQTDAEEAEMNARMAALLAEGRKSGPVAAA